MTTVVESMGLSADQVRRALELAVLAPSVHNTQPWLFRVLPDRIEVHADWSRLLKVADPDGRELRLSCGAAAANLGLALQGEGVRTVVTIRPRDTSGAEVLIRSSGSAPMADSERVLFKAIADRHTNRRPFLDTAIPVEHRTALYHAAQHEVCWLEELREPARRLRLREIIRTAHRTQIVNLAYQHEWSTWTGRSHATTDGVPTTAAGPAPADQDLWLLRDFGQQDSPPRLDGKDFESEPLILVLATHSDGPAAQIKAGIALQRSLLTATSLGLAASFLSQPIEVQAQRVELQRLLGGGLRPQTVLRVGFGSPVAATPRRPLEDVLTDVRVPLSW